jgi:hypothetical protein
MKTLQTISQAKRRTTIVLAAVLALAAVGCGGAPEKPASLSRTYTLTDEQGRQAGTLVLNPLGGGEVRDSDGRVIGMLVSPDKNPAAAGESAEKKE